MPLVRQLSRAIDQEHRSTMALFAHVEAALAGSRPGDETASARWPAALAPLVPALVGEIEAQIERHFDFEEQEIFPRLIESGRAGIAAMLSREHGDIRALGVQMLPMLHALASGSLGAPRAAQLRPLVEALLVRMAAHVHKETAGLLPLVDELFDEQADREAVRRHAAVM